MSIMMTFNEFILERKHERKPAKEGLLNSRTIPQELKDKILPYISSDSYYCNKKVLDLMTPKIDGKSFDGVDMGANKNGFFVCTHRARSKSYESPEKIPDSKIAFIKSTG